MNLLFRNKIITYNFLIMKTNYFKSIFLTLSMSVITNNIWAMYSSALSCVQEINQTKDEKDKEKESDDDNGITDEKNNAPILTVNGTGKSATFTINTGNLQHDQPIQITVPHGFSVSPTNIPANTKNAKITVTLNSTKKETKGIIVLRSGDSRSYIRIQGIGTPLPTKTIAESPIYKGGKNETFENTKFKPTEKGYTVEFRVKINEEGDEFHPYMVDNDGYGIKGFVASTSIGVYNSNSQKGFSNPLTKQEGGLGKFYNNDNRMHTYRYAITPDKRAFVYRDGFPIDTIRLADYGNQSDFAVANGEPKENLLKNPGFEGEYDYMDGGKLVKAVEGWNIAILDRWNNEQFILPQEIDNEQDFNNHIFRIKPYKWAGGWGNGNINQTIDVAPNETYTLSALARGGLDKKKGTLTAKMFIQEVEDREKKVETEIASDTWETYSLDFTTSPTCKQIRVIFQIQAGTWGANISPLDVDNVKLTGTSRTYSPKIGFENNNAEIEYFTYDLSGAYAPEQPEITINITE